MAQRRQRDAMQTGNIKAERDDSDGDADPPTKRNKKGATRDRRGGERHAHERERAARAPLASRAPRAAAASAAAAAPPLPLRAGMISDPSSAAFGEVACAIAPGAVTALDFYRFVVDYARGICLEKLGLFDSVLADRGSRLRHEAFVKATNDSVERKSSALIESLGCRRARRGEGETLGWRLIDMAHRCERLIARVPDDPRRPFVRASARPDEEAGRAGSSNGSSSAAADACLPCRADAIPSFYPFGIPRDSKVALPDLRVLTFHVRDGTCFTVAVAAHVAHFLCRVHGASHPASYVLGSKWFENLARYCIAVSNIRPPPSAAAAAAAPAPSDLERGFSRDRPEPDPAPPLSRVIGKCDSAKLRAMCEEIASCEMQMFISMKAWCDDRCAYAELVFQLAKLYHP